MNTTRHLNARFVLLLLAVALVLAIMIAAATAIEYEHTTGPQLAASMVEYA